MALAESLVSLVYETKVVLPIHVSRTNVRSLLSTACLSTASWENEL